MTSAMRLYRYTFFVTALFFLAGSRSHLVAAPMLGNCEDVCTGEADCGTECLYNLDSEETCGDWGTCAPDCSAVCGASANCDLACSGGGDCGSYNGGQSNGECYGTCGDGACSIPEENEAGCPADCTPTSCGTSSCSQDSDCPDSCGDGVCVDSCCMYYDAPHSCCDPGTCPSGYDGTCGSSSDCCSNELCVITIGSGSGQCRAFQC